MDNCGQKLNEGFHSGERLRLARQLKGHQLKDLVKPFKISVSAIQKWQGKRGIPKHQIAIVADFFKVGEYLFSDDFTISREEFKNEIIGSSLKKKNAVQDKNIQVQSPILFQNQEYTYSELISSASDEATVFFYKGCEFNNKNNLDQAILNFNKSINLGPSDPEILYETYHSRGYCWYQKGDLKKAMDDYINSISFRSAFGEHEIFDVVTDKPFKRLRFPWYNQIGQEQTIEDFNQILSKYPDNSMVQYLRGREYIDLSDYDLTLDDLNHAIIIEPESNILDEFYCVRGYAYYKKGDFSNAITDFSQAINLSSKEKLGVIYYRALAFEKRGLLCEAIEDLNNYLEVDPNNNEVIEKHNDLKSETGLCK